MSASSNALLWIGICVLLPYNCLLLAYSYFDKYVFPDKSFPFTSMIAYSTVLSSTQVFLTFRGDMYSVGSRMRLALFLSGIMCLGLLVISAIGTGHAAEMYIPCLAVVALLAASNALLQSAAFGVAGAIGQEMSQAVMLGLGVSGLISLALSLGVSGADNLFNFAGKDAAKLGIVTNIVMFAVSILFTLMSHWVFFVYLSVRDSQGAAALAQLETQREALKQQLAMRQISEREVSLQTIPSTHAPLARPTGTQALRQSQDAEAACSTETRTNFERILGVLQEVAPQAFNVVMIYVVTMTVFPSVLLKWTPGSSSWFASNPGLFASILVGCFQVFDVVSRQVAGWSIKYVPANRLWILCWLRLVLVPLFIFGQRSPTSFFLWGSDMGRLLLCATLAFTNGLFSSWAMMYGPQLCPPERRESAGMAMSCCLVVGIFIGTLLAFATQIGA